MERAIELLHSVLEVCDDYFVDEMYNGEHTTVNMCPLCGNTTDCADDCIVPKIREFLKEEF